MNAFDEMLLKMKSLNNDFDKSSRVMIDWVDNAPDFLALVDSIGCIPEAIEHDSSEEKLFSKVSDAVLARGFRELGLKATVLEARGDSADVVAQSRYHGYSLVADAKAFRLSRTARNQKDYKIAALSGWRKDNDYAVLCAPYFQYPTNNSQIYMQAASENVALFSWEYLSLLICCEIRETVSLDLSSIWNWQSNRFNTTIAGELKKCCLKEQDCYLSSFLGIETESFAKHMSCRICDLQERAEKEIDFWRCKETALYRLTREEAIEQLIEEMKLRNKIETIQRFVGGLNYE